MAVPTHRLWRHEEEEETPDNHTDGDTFLKQLRVNVDLKMYSFKEAVFGSLILLQQFALVVFLVIIFALVHGKHISAVQTAVGFTAVMFLCYAGHRSIADTLFLNPLTTDLQTLGVLYGFAFGLSPVLLSLTKTVSTDTIYSMVTMLLLASLAFHDYGPRERVASQTLSMNAGFAAAICLASRLSSSLDAFALSVSAVGILGLWPSMRSVLIRKYPSLFTLLTLGITCVDFVLIYGLSGLSTVLFGLAVVTLALLVPALFVHLQKYKTTIHGPWDEAVIKCGTPPPVAKST